MGLTGGYLSFFSRALFVPRYLGGSFLTVIFQLLCGYFGWNIPSLCFWDIWGLRRLSAILVFGIILPPLGLVTMGGILLYCRHPRASCLSTSCLSTIQPTNIYYYSQQPQFQDHPRVINPSVRSFLLPARSPTSCIPTSCIFQHTHQHSPVKGTTLTLQLIKPQSRIVRAFMQDEVFSAPWTPCRPCTCPTNTRTIQRRPPSPGPPKPSRIIR